jgi:hypothetical protein
MRLFANVATPDQLREIANGLRDGKPLTHSYWTPRERLLSEGQFTSLQHILVKYGRADWNDPERHENGITLTRAGLAFFAGLQSTSPLRNDAKETPSGASGRQTDSDFTPFPVGEGT